MKRILLSSFFVAACAVAMAQVKPASKQTAPFPKKRTASAQPNAATVAYKKKVEADLKNGKTPVQSVNIQKAN